jgi:phosphatidylserine/phosphatidylglycerophosphate/cardiolipin synthase-like enzyme
MLAVGAVLILSTCLLYGREAISFSSRPAATEDDIALYFSPKGGCTEAIVAQIEKARASIDVQAYSFTSTEIAKALAEAQLRGVKVRMSLDKQATGEHYSGGTYLADHQVAVWTDGQHPIAHNKVMIIDGSTIITGSFNFTRQAENSNAENLLVITGKPKIAKAYEENFQRHLEHSVKYAGHL